MSHASIANLYPSEGVLVGSPVVITFPWHRCSQLVVTNDSTINDLSVTLNNNTLTLKPTETLTTTMRLGGVTVNGTGAYRVWAFG